MKEKTAYAMVGKKNQERFKKYVEGKSYEKDADGDATIPDEDVEKFMKMKKGD